MSAKERCFLAVLFFTSIIYSQSEKSDFKAIYEIKSLRNIEEIEGAEAKKLLSSTITSLETFEFELFINKEKSLFKKSTQLKSDDVPEYIYNIAIAFCHGDKKWYTQIKDSKKYVLTEDSGEPLVLILEETLDWNITGEKKKFGDYLLIQATTTRKEGTRQIPIVAWFTSQLPYNFGPLGFTGLPGLILELRTPEVVFNLKSFEKNESRIKKPNIRRALPYQEYYTRLDEDMKSIMENGH